MRAKLYRSLQAGTIFLLAAMARGEGQGSIGGQVVLVEIGADKFTLTDLQLLPAAGQSPPGFRQAAVQRGAPPARRFRRQEAVRVAGPPDRTGPGA